eukprot:CAMPEP_0194312384 /NCGR_PEP_ID=MMETSP0171-20130528/9312_1 /TAXON_ID=218684 /ORGANISM="Corethron pennatum, Strain L29A3" /LENGTH=90 /DNA_ID=CAMNT_0039066873 /DNA_START=114 /DNA_END=383 /DNA_ORIENTATION=-
MGPHEEDTAAADDDDLVPTRPPSFRPDGPPDRPPGTGTLPSSTVNLCSATLGAGVLSLPYACRTGGLLPALCLLLLSAAVTSVSVDVLVA